MKLFKVFVNGVMKKTMMADTRIMILSLDRNDEVDCACDQDGDLQTFTAKRNGTYQLQQSKEGVLALKLSEEEE